MRLASLNPSWSGGTFAGAVRHGIGISFDCPSCPGCYARAGAERYGGPEDETPYRLSVLFKNALDGQAAPSQLVTPARTFWQRDGATFDDLTLAPSVDCSAFGHWHGFITAGAITTCKP